ncbi:hypothetical protein LCGC14_2336930, partial [marine sediment metagenome]
MIDLKYQILIAVVLDLIAGDPRWMPHPVKLIGRLAVVMEWPARRLLRRPRLAGIVAALSVIGLSGAVAWGLVQAAGWLHPAVGDAVSILLIVVVVAAGKIIRSQARLISRSHGVIGRLIVVNDPTGGRAGTVN